MFSPILSFEGSVNYLIFDEIEFTRILASFQWITNNERAVIFCLLPYVPRSYILAKLYEPGQVGKYTAQKRKRGRRKPALIFILILGTHAC